MLNIPLGVFRRYTILEELMILTENTLRLYVTGWAMGLTREKLSRLLMEAAETLDRFLASHVFLEMGDDELTLRKELAIFLSIALNTGGCVLGKSAQELDLGWYIQLEPAARVGIVAIASDPHTDFYVFHRSIRDAGLGEIPLSILSILWKVLRSCPPIVRAALERQLLPGAFS